MIRWTGHVTLYRDDRWTRAVADWISLDIKETSGRPPARWPHCFTKSLNERNAVLRLYEARTITGLLWLATANEVGIRDVVTKNKVVKGARQ
uniref:Integrase n=1 Tax=Haemonchus contortus TaxID=6289 RepID=A0A7I4YGE1_HAECO